MKRFKSMILPLLAMLTIPLISILYVLLNHHEGTAYSLVTDLDRHLPFVKFFVLPYLFWFFYIILALFYLIKIDRTAYYRTLILYDLGLLIANLVYFFYQTTVPRPEIEADDLFNHMVSLVYQIDQPFNCFPSLHVFTTYLIMKSIHTYSTQRMVKLVIHVIGILIILSTLFIKQHVILDVIGAVILAEILLKISNFFTKEGVGNWVKRESLLLTMKKRYET